MLKSKITCLVIDDDLDDQEFFKEAINDLNENINVLVASSCNEGLEKLNTIPRPDYIFLDLNMPKLGGVDCLKKIKQDYLLKTIPVFILTTSSQEKDKKETLALGASDFITKPMSINDFSSILKTKLFA